MNVTAAVAAAAAAIGNFGGRSYLVPTRGCLPPALVTRRAGAEMVLE
jgi:hypothetical protein